MKVKDIMKLVEERPEIEDYNIIINDGWHDDKIKNFELFIDNKNISLNIMTDEIFIDFNEYENLVHGYR